MKQLVPAWAFPAGFPPPNLGLRQGLESAALVVDGVLYFEGMQNNVYAVDAATGKELWNYTTSGEKSRSAGSKARAALRMPMAGFSWAARTTTLSRLTPKPGTKIWNVEVEDFFQCVCKITGAPLIVKDKVITGVAGGGQLHMRGYIDAFDIKTGQRVWHFDTIPSPDQPGGDTWPGDTWKMGGGATWNTGTYDPELNLVYWGTGDPSPAYQPDTRPGANLYATSLLALDADTGKLKWYFQETPHDLYDYDSQPEAMILDLEIGGKKRKVVLHASKNGFAYIYDRETGQFLRAYPYGSPNWAKGIDENGKPIDPLVPEQQTDFIICPSMASGARGINHGAYSPRTGLWYTTDFELCSYLKGGDTPPVETLNPKVLPNITAFEPATGKKVWTFNTKFYNMSSSADDRGRFDFRRGPGRECVCARCKNGPAALDLQHGRAYFFSSGYVFRGWQAVRCDFLGRRLADRDVRSASLFRRNQRPGPTTQRYSFCVCLARKRESKPEFAVVVKYDAANRGFVLTI